MSNTVWVGPFQRRTWLYWLGAISITLLSLFLAVRKVEWSEALVAFRNADSRWVSSVLLCVAVNVLLKAIRWRSLYGVNGHQVGLVAYTEILLAGQAVNVLYPARLGDLVRARGIGRQTNGMTYALGTILTEKVLDTLAYAVLIILLLLSFSMPDWLQKPSLGVFLMAVALGIILLALTLGGERWLVVFEWLTRWLPPHPHQWVYQRVEIGLTSLNVLRNIKTLLVLTLLTSLTWLTAILNNWLAFQAVNLSLSIGTAALLAVALQAGISLPAAPGAVGVFQYVCVLVLGLFGVTSSTAFGYGVLLHILIMMPTTLLGLFCLWRSNLIFRETA